VRTVTVEFRTADLELLGLIPPGLFERFEEMELMETLRLERGFRLQLLRLRRKGPLRSAAELRAESRRIRALYGLEEFELVERRPDTRDYLVLVRQRNPRWLQRLVAVAGGAVRPTAPFRITAEKVLATFQGPEATVRKILRRLEREELHYEVVRATTRPYLADPGASELTHRQTEAVARAWALGYFAIPRRVTLTRLARVTGQSPPALGKMLRRAEGHLIARFLASRHGVAALRDPEKDREPVVER
jgi:predicted DNA binding protein